MNIKKHVTEINKNGFSIIKKIFTKNECEEYIQKCENLLKSLLKRNQVNTFSAEAQDIDNPFQYDSFFFKQVYFKKIDKLLKILLDENYVLINSNLINRRKFYHPKINNTTSRAAEWHTDSRYLGGKRLSKGLSYIVYVALEDFSIENGGTCYIPGSHLTTKIPKRNANYKHKVLSLKRGNMIIFDSGLWHKGGESTNKSRWTIFNYYGPWWMKPYYSFDQMLGKNKLKNLNTDLKKMLHYYSKPPKNSRIRTNTLTSPVEKKY
jgi:ectoine hydroxylase-related dioxygenase (phytanoyl-CoA dioxygenase family)|tara:strand:+ start:131 stop:922 length:792 start_codon:yes stop_codon:yes gene_type:complete